MQLDTDKELSQSEISNGIPASTFTFADALGSLWKDAILPGAQVYGQIQVAEAQAAAQAKLNQLKQTNATLGSNQPAAAQAQANKTLLQQWLPTNQDGTIKPAGFLPWIVLGFVALLALIIIRRIMK